jgi:hypothetical protein
MMRCRVHATRRRCVPGRAPVPPQVAEVGRTPARQAEGAGTLDGRFSCAAVAHPPGPWLALPASRSRWAFANHHDFVASGTIEVAWVEMFAPICAKRAGNQAARNRPLGRRRAITPARAAVLRDRCRGADRRRAEESLVVDAAPTIHVGRYALALAHLPATSTRARAGSMRRCRCRPWARSSRPIGAPGAGPVAPRSELK